MFSAETERHTGEAHSTLPSRDAALSPDPGLDSIRIDLKRERKSRAVRLTSLNREMIEAIADGDDARRHVTDVLIRTTEAMIRELDDALTRMKTGTYGRCERCTETIPAGRLDIRPTNLRMPVRGIRHGKNHRPRMPFCPCAQSSLASPEKTLPSFRNWHSASHWVGYYDVETIGNLIVNSARFGIS